MTLAQAIKAELAAQGVRLSLTRFAALTGVSRQAIHKARCTPSGRLLEACARHLCITRSALMRRMEG